LWTRRVRPFFRTNLFYGESGGLAGLAVLDGAPEVLATNVPARSVGVRTCLIGFIVSPHQELLPADIVGCAVWDMPSDGAV
jgi:hypothetical protein